ncbi:MAG TPA: hypothetical protein VJ783_18145 [Pirellulales bacterium]|nr:hypothetical protein [Pirellulales bacterium]
MISAAGSLLGVGIYSPDEAARYARVTTRTMQRWVFGDSFGEPVIQSQLATEGDSERLVTFVDFVQVLAVRQVRIREKRFPLQKIRKACEVASAHYGLEYPLAAKEHKIYLFGPKDNLAACEMVVLFGQDEAGEDLYLQLTGKKAGNFVLSAVAEPFMSKLRFGESPFAEEYVAWERGDRHIVMNPHKRFGEPFFPSTGYTAQALWEAYVAEGGVENAAKAYGVDADDVELACEYFDYLTGRDAA